MSASVTRIVAVAGLLIVLGAVNYSIYGKEETIRSGETVYLELAPVDPRSLMQGDYLALRFRLTGEIAAARLAGTLADSERTAPLALDDRRVATLGSANDTGLRMRFHILGFEQVWLGTNAYFFAEGTADRYATARYGEFRLSAATGEAVLVGLRDENLNSL
ncbi:MAG TPA: GDYXXLXY domain-containing protein [Gammaproteobacteria bacterium]|jgi:uncharacterized membrane-anchored protein